VEKTVSPFGQKEKNLGHRRRKALEEVQKGVTLCGQIVKMSVGH
jgi:hypothetical protein